MTRLAFTHSHLLPHIYFLFSQLDSAQPKPKRHSHFMNNADLTMFWIYPRLLSLGCCFFYFIFSSFTSFLSLYNLKTKILFSLPFSSFRFRFLFSISIAHLLFTPALAPAYLETTFKFFLEGSLVWSSCVVITKVVD